MNDRRCRYCQQAFRPAPFHPQQLVCGKPECQRQRRNDYRRQKIASDPVYQQVCLDSPRKWRGSNPDYWKKYRQDHPEQVERNRRQQRLRDLKRRLANLANNNLAAWQLLSFQSSDASEQASPLLANNIFLVPSLLLPYKSNHVVRIFQVPFTDSGTSGGA
jgi:hypothetical protein